jgi:replicative DNA helicase
MAANPPETRLPPHNLEAERATLGSILRDNRVADDVFAVVPTHEAFYMDAHQRIYKAIRDLLTNGKAVDLVTLSEELYAGRDVERIGGYGYLTQVFDATPAAANAEYHARIVKGKWILRQMMHKATEILRAAYEPFGEAEEVVAWAADQLCGIEAHDGDDFQHISEVLRQTEEYIDQIQTEGAGGIPYGIIDLDRLTSGMHKEEFIIVAARPSVGKTQFGLQVAREAAKRGSRVAFATLEMSKHRELALRMLCADNHTNPHKFRAGMAGQHELHAYQETAREAACWSLHLADTPTLTCSKLLAGARKIQRKDGLDLLCVDYLQLVSSDRRFDSRRLEVADISRRLKLMAKQLDIPVLCMCQLNRGAEARADGEPNLSDLRDAGEIEQDADTVLMLWRDTQRQGITHLKIAKQRNGPVGAIEMVCLPHVQRFENSARA